MTDIANINLDYNRPVKIADGVYWVGFYDEKSGLHPGSIRALIYQHYDPDLCGSIPNFEDIIGSDKLRVISEKTNNVFIRHYYVTSEMMSIDDMDFAYKFSSGRTLRFIKTPYAHSTGSFVTLDEQTVGAFQQRPLRQLQQPVGTLPQDGR
jgi:hypothetical protein